MNRLTMYKYFFASTLGVVFLIVGIVKSSDVAYILGQIWLATALVVSTVERRE